MDIAVTRMSSKGQVVIPQEMREDLAEGDKMIVIKDSGNLILKKVADLGKNFDEDIRFARRTEKAWQSYAKGEFVSMSKDDFLTKLRKC